MTSKLGTLGRVYGGDPNLIHIPDRERRAVGERLAEHLEWMMRERAHTSGSRDYPLSQTQDLCPGCYMIAGFNMLVALAQQNNQSLTELGSTMAEAFAHLANNPDDPFTEEIKVILDKDDEPCDTCPTPEVNNVYSEWSSFLDYGNL